MLREIITWDLFYVIIRSSTPIMIAAMAAVISKQAGIMNIGIEGIMLIGAFSGFSISYFTGNWLLALLGTALIGTLVAAFMVIAHLKYGSNIFIIGNGINLLAIALTKFLLSAMFGVQGSITDPHLNTIPKISIGILEKVPALDAMFNNYSLLEVASIVLVIVVAYMLYRTPWGLRLRSIGLSGMAAETAGIRVNRMKFQVLVISGILAALAGAHLSIGYSSLFAENMTNGRGFMGVSAMAFGSGNPILAAACSLIFGACEAVGARLQIYGFPSQFVLMLPYVITLLVLSVSVFRQFQREQKQKSSLYKKNAANVQSNPCDS